VAEAACAEVACGASGARRWCDRYLKTHEPAPGNPGLQMNRTWKSGARGSHRPAEPRRNCLYRPTIQPSPRRLLVAADCLQ